MKPSALRWGLIFITAGVILILNNAGYLDWEYWWYLLTWWPLILIAIGIEKIFVKTKASYLAYLSPLILIGMMIFIAYDTGIEKREDHNYFSSYRWDQELPEGVVKIKATIEHGRNDVRILRNSLNLASLKVDRFSRKPDIEYELVNGIATVDIDSRGRRSPVIVINGRNFIDDWRFSLYDGLPVDLKCVGDGSDLNLSLENVFIENLIVENDEGDINLKLGGKSEKVDIDITGEDARLKLRFPENAGILIAGDNYQDYLRELNFSESDGSFKSPNFDSSTTKISVVLDDDLRSLRINFY